MVGDRSEALDERIKNDPSAGFECIKGQTGPSSHPGDHQTDGIQDTGRVTVRTYQALGWVKQKKQHLSLTSH